MSNAEDRTTPNPPFISTPDTMSCEEDLSGNDTDRFDESEDEIGWSSKQNTALLRPPPSLSLPDPSSLFDTPGRLISPRPSRRQRAMARTRSLHRSSECLIPLEEGGLDKPQTVKRTESPNAPLATLAPIKRSRSVQYHRHAPAPMSPDAFHSPRRQLFSPRRAEPPTPASTQPPTISGVPTPISLQSVSQPLFFGGCPNSASAPEFPIPCLDDENVIHPNVAGRPRSGAVSTGSSAVRRSVSDLSMKQAPRPCFLSMSCSNLSTTRPSGSDIHDTIYPPIVPVLPKSNQFHEISGSTLVDLMEGRYENNFERVIIIDCRNKYEFDGGHIRGAISVVPDDLEPFIHQQFMTNPVPRPNWIIIFHCEFSVVRGPRGYDTLRGMDRQANGIANYPRCYYPYVYVLHGGYRTFHEKWNGSPYCGDYVPMSCKDNTCQKLLKKKPSRKWP